jgi:hypothetical protein
MVIRALTLAVGMIVAVTGHSLAQETMGDKRVNTATKVEVVRVDDVEGHVLLLIESKGYDLGSGNVVINKAVADLVKGNGRHWGYVKTLYKDGDISHSRFEGEVMTRPGSDGKPQTRAEGTWSMISGTGKWENRTARGTYKSTNVAEGMNFVEWEGAWESKR